MTRAARQRQDAHEQVLERRKHRDEAQEVDHVHRHYFPPRPGAGDDSANADQHRVQGTPVEIDQCRPATTDNGVAQIEIRDAVGADAEALRIRLKCRECENRDPRGEPYGSRHAVMA